MIRRALVLVALFVVVALFGGTRGGGGEVDAKGRALLDVEVHQTHAEPVLGPDHTCRRSYRDDSQSICRSRAATRGRTERANKESRQREPECEAPRHQP